jgi:hypothetical protein
MQGAGCAGTCPRVCAPARAIIVPRARTRRGKAFVTAEIMISKRHADVAGSSGSRSLGR